MIIFSLSITARREKKIKILKRKQIVIIKKKTLKFNFVKNKIHTKVENRIRHLTVQLV